MLSWPTYISACAPLPHTLNLCMDVCVMIWIFELKPNTHASHRIAMYTFGCYFWSLVTIFYSLRRCLSFCLSLNLEMVTHTRITHIHIFKSCCWRDKTHHNVKMLQNSQLLPYTHICLERETGERSKNLNERKSKSQRLYVAHFSSDAHKMARKIPTEQK